MRTALVNVNDTWVLRKAAIRAMVRIKSKDSKNGFELRSVARLHDDIAAVIRR